MHARAFLSVTRNLPLYCRYTGWFLFARVSNAPRGATELADGSENSIPAAGGMIPHAPYLTPNLHPPYLTVTR